MNGLHIFLVWVHLAAATFWVGGMLFLSFVAVPVLKQAPDPSSAQREFVNLARRFRTLVWVALTLLFLTGAALLPRYLNLNVFPTDWPPTVLVKLSLVGLLILTSFLHDMVVGPKVRTLKQKPIEHHSQVESLVLKISPFIGRITTVLGLGILLAASVMVRA